ncbi:MAG: amidohydrolase family protein [Clostridia bacterium]|nr:amidohydrolase family protein [Clostridia bacterium]
MVIDFHTHAFPDNIHERAVGSLVTASRNRLRPYHNGSLSGLLSSMNNFGVDLSVVQPVITKPSQTKHLNEWAAKITEENKNIISFGGIHPHSPTWKEDIDFVCSLGLRGLKFHCEYQNFKVDDPFMLKIYDYAFSKGLIILHHAGYDPAFRAPFKSSPRMFYNVSKAMQGGVMIAAHLGGIKQWRRVEKYIVGTNIYIDTSMGQGLYDSKQFLRIVKNHGADKILFGSDSPWGNAKFELEKFNSLPLTDEERELILHKNAEKLLNI